MSFPAPGRPGNLPRWTSSTKVGLGTAISSDSHVWFTISHGIVNEVYYPKTDIANIRDFGFIVTDREDFFSEEKRDAIHAFTTVEEGVPAYHLTNTCNKGKYLIEKIIITDQRRNVLLQEVTFIPLEGNLSDYSLYALLAPHIFNAGYGNNGWIGDYKGQRMLFAEHSGHFLSLQCNVPFKEMTCGYVGISDAWQDLNHNKQLTQTYHHAKDGNIALCGEIDLVACNGKFVIALGFANHFEEAALQTKCSLLKSFRWSLEEYMDAWRNLHIDFLNLGNVDGKGGSIYKTSLAVLKIHEGKDCNRNVISSLSIPWGAYKSDYDLGNYHHIWPRDQVHTAQAFLAAGDDASARQILLFLMGTQEVDGHWVQCMWEDGTPYWTGLQLDETASPILLADMLRRQNKLNGIDPSIMVEKAAAFLVLNGPVTEQDRWEELGGYSPYTLAVEIAALLAAADFLDLKGKKFEAEFLRQTADWWNASLENWLYVTNTELCKQHQIEGYYVRITPFYQLIADKPENKQIQLKNLPVGQNLADYTELVSVDALALVRFGLREPNDPKILNTLQLIDKMLKTETNKGPAWHRFNHDGYGEKEYGLPFDGTGIGRAWPVLGGERAHYELAEGNFEEAINLLRVFAGFAGTSGLLPEQVWDTADIVEKNLFNGHSTGSAKPLVWAHAEYIMLLRSLKDKKVFDMPPQTMQRYLKDKTESKHGIWRFNHKILKLPQGKTLRLIAHSDSVIRWSTDNWNTIKNDVFIKNKLDIRYADLPTSKLEKGTKILFTFYWTDSARWEGINYEIEVV